LIDLIVSHKPGTSLSLRSSQTGWLAAEWHAFYKERATYAEVICWLPRPEAEMRAWQCCVPEWLNRHPLWSPPGQCLGCGGTEYSHDPLVPFECRSSGLAWLHTRC
jgi:hypothetical protein